MTSYYCATTLISSQSVFIVGFPRSGTTLMRGLLGSHPQVAFFKSEIPIRTYLDRIDAQFNLAQPKGPRAALMWILEQERFQNAGVPLDVTRILNSLPSPPLAPAQVLVAVMREYASQRGRSIWGIKQPGAEFSADLLLSAFPGSKIVHLVRDPRDVVVSLKSQVQVGAIPTGVKSPRMWKTSARIARQYEAQYPECYVAVRYEDLVIDSEAVLRKLCVQLGLPFDPDMLEMQGHPGWRGGNSVFQDVGRQSAEVRASPVGRYRTMLSLAELCYYETVLGEEMQVWGYELEKPALAFSDRAKSLALFALEGMHCLATRALWKTHQVLCRFEGDRAWTRLLCNHLRRAAAYGDSLAWRIRLGRWLANDVQQTC